MGETVDVVILDIAKSFDTVCHHLRLLKPDRYGINVVLLNWTGISLVIRQCLSWSKMQNQELRV